MLFGSVTEFAIEVYHEPSGPQWAGFGRMALDVQGVRLGDIQQNHCSLFHAVERFRELRTMIDTLWDESFNGLTNAQIFSLLDRSLYDCEERSERFGRFDFLTNTGEMFDDSKTFIACDPAGYVHILYRKYQRDTPDSRLCRVDLFRSVTDSFLRWFDVQTQTAGPPYFPISPSVK
jgi:hypothetical protein